MIIQIRTKYEQIFSVSAYTNTRFNFSAFKEKYFKTDFDVDADLS